MASECKTIGCDRESYKEGLCSLHLIFWTGLFAVNPEYKKMSDEDLDVIKAHLDGWNSSNLSKAAGIPRKTLLAALSQDRVIGEKRQYSSAGQWYISIYEGARVIWLYHYWITARIAAKVCEDFITCSAVSIYAKNRLLGPICWDLNRHLCLRRTLVEDTEGFRQLVKRVKAERAKNKPTDHTFHDGEVSAARAAKLLGIDRVAFRRYFPEWQIKHTMTKAGYYRISLKSLRLFINEVRHGQIAVHPTIRRKIEKAKF